MKKIEPTKQNIIILAVIAAIVIGAGVYFLFYAPLVKKLAAKYLECRKCENDVLEVRDIIRTAGEVYGKRVLMTERDTPLVMDELTKSVKERGINFISIKPAEARLKEEYKILPVEMEIESTYRELGSLLGALDDLEKGVVRVESFNIRPYNGNPAKLITNLTVHIYLSARETSE